MCSIGLVFDLAKRLITILDHPSWYLALTVGLVLGTALLAGRIARILHLPSVTAYLLASLALGPTSPLLEIIEWSAERFGYSLSLAGWHLSEEHLVYLEPGRRLRNRARVIEHGLSLSLITFSSNHQTLDTVVDWRIGCHNDPGNRRDVVTGRHAVRHRAELAGSRSLWCTGAGHRTSNDHPGTEGRSQFRTTDRIHSRTGRTEQSGFDCNF